MDIDVATDGTAEQSLVRFYERNGCLRRNTRFDNGRPTPGPVFAGFR